MIGVASDKEASLCSSNGIASENAGPTLPVDHTMTRLPASNAPPPQPPANALPLMSKLPKEPSASAPEHTKRDRAVCIPVAAESGVSEVLTHETAKLSLKETDPVPTTCAPLAVPETTSSTTIETKGGVPSSEKDDAPPSCDAPPALYSIPTHACHTFGKLHIPTLPPLESIDRLTHLPKVGAPTLRVERVPCCQRPVAESADVAAFYRRQRCLSNRSDTAASSESYSAHHPYLASVTRNERVTTHPDAVKQTHSVSLTVGPDGQDGWAGTPCQPGDAFGVCAPNPHQVALALAARFGGLSWVPAEGQWTSPVVHITGHEPSSSAGSPAGSSSSTLSTLPVTFRDRPLVAAPPTDRVGHSLPSRLPTQGHYYSVYELFRYVVDVSGVPKKPLLRMLAEYTTDPAERKLLLFLCSRQGILAYKAMTETYPPTLLHVLESIPHAQLHPIPPPPPSSSSMDDHPVPDNREEGQQWPQLAEVLAALGPLLPRYYSHTESPVTNPWSLTTLFNVTKYAVGPHGAEHRVGVASSWLASATPTCAEKDTTNAPITIPVFPHPSRHFHLPSDMSIPMVWVAPGTGIAPFLAFARHRRALMQEARCLLSGGADNEEGGQEKETSQRNVEEGLHPSEVDARCTEGVPPLLHEERSKFGTIHLFQGCRHPHLDWLARDELRTLAAEGVLTLHLACSRAPRGLVPEQQGPSSFALPSGSASPLPCTASPCSRSRLSTAITLPLDAAEGSGGNGLYVQDLLREYRDVVADVIERQQGYVYVCGDAKNMGRDVMAAITDVLHTHYRTRLDLDHNAAASVTPTAADTAAATTTSSGVPVSSLSTSSSVSSPLTTIPVPSPPTDLKDRVDQNESEVSAKKEDDLRAAAVDAVATLLRTGRYLQDLW